MGSPEIARPAGGSGRGRFGRAPVLPLLAGREDARQLPLEGFSSWAPTIRHERAHFLRAVMEGIAMEDRRALECLCPAECRALSVAPAAPPRAACGTRSEPTSSPVRCRCWAPPKGACRGRPSWPGWRQAGMPTLPRVRGGRPPGRYLDPLSRDRSGLRARLSHVQCHSRHLGWAVGKHGMIGSDHD